MVVLLTVPASLFAQGYDKWYLAEGATGSFFEEEILVGNPNTTAADITITFLRPGLSTVVRQFTMAPTSRVSVRVNGIPGLEDTAVSAVVECTNTLDIVVERSMYFRDGAKVGGHNANGVTSPATRWLFAEGATGFFDQFILVQNPDTATAAAVTATFLKEDGSTTVRDYTVAPSSRFTLWVNQQVPGLSNAAFSTVIETTNGVGVIAERAMYFDGLDSGHTSVGVPAPATSWRFAEGFTGSGFGGALELDTYLLLGNPGTTAADVRVTYFREASAPVVATHTVAPTSRLNIYTNAVTGLANSVFSMLVESLNAVPIVAERAVYFGSNGRWVEAHETSGLTGDAQKWAFAEGLEDGALNPGAPNVYFDSFFLVSNANPQPLALRATFMREDGTGIVREFSVPAESRFTLSTGAFPELSNQGFATFLESTNGLGFTAERTVYWADSNGGVWFAGHGSAGTPWTGVIGSPPPPPAPTLAAVAPASGPAAGGTEVTLTGTNFVSGATVTIGGLPATDVRVIDATTITAVTPPHTAATVPIVVTSNAVTLTLDTAFAYIAAVNHPPVIHSLTSNGARLEAGGQLQLTASVTDTETPVDQLTYTWAATPPGGTFIGTGSQVAWQAPQQQPSPAVYTLTLTVTESYSGGQQQHTVSSSVQVHYNDSDAEITGLVIQFLDDFSTFSVSPAAAVRNFSDSCPGKADELQDITLNRQLFHIRGGTYFVSSIGYDSPRTFADIVAPCTFFDTVIATGVDQTVVGTCLLTAVYENWRWLLCDSHFAGAKPATSLDRHRVP